MKRKFKHWWSIATIPPISTITSHRQHKRRSWNMTLEIQVKAQDRHTNLWEQVNFQWDDDDALYVPLVVNNFRSFPHLWLITGFVTRFTRRMSLLEQELLTLPEHPSSPPVFSGVRVTRSLVLYVCFVDRCLSFSTFSSRHCVVCSSSIYGFRLPLWYLQTLLVY
jgi:hypothetical protein